MFQDVGEVDEDVDPHAAAGRFSAGQVQLVAGTVDQHHPGAPVGRIPLLRLVEDRLDDLLAVGGDRAGQPLGLRVGTEPAAALAAAALGSGGGDTDDVVGAAATVSSSTCRLPTTYPQRRPIASVAWSNEPRTASRAASRCSPWLWRSRGSRRAASAG